MEIVFLYLLYLRVLHSNISTGSAASINSSNSSSSNISITENDSFISVIDVQVNKFEDKITFVLALDLNSFPRLARNDTCVIKMHKKTRLFTAIRWGWND